MSLEDDWMCCVSQGTVFACSHICSIDSTQYVRVSEVFKHFHAHNVACAWTISPFPVQQIVPLLRLCYNDISFTCTVYAWPQAILFPLHCIFCVPFCLVQFRSNDFVLLLLAACVILWCNRRSVIYLYAPLTVVSSADGIVLQALKIQRMDLGRECTGGETLCHTDLMSRHLVAHFWVRKWFCNRSLTSRRLVCCHSSKWLVWFQRTHLRLSHVIAQGVGWWEM